MDRDASIRIIRYSELHDAEWYLSINEDVAAANRDPAIHYYEDGAKEERDPGPRFSTKFYIERYPDVRSSGLNPLVHYATIGANEGRVTEPDKYWFFSRDPDSVSIRDLISSSDIFDEDWYIQEYLKDFLDPPDPIAHYMLEGHEKRYNPSIKFNTAYYLSQNIDVAKANINSLLHYITAGQLEGRLPVEPVLTLAEYITKFSPQREAIRVYANTSSRKDIFVVTDSLNKNSFFGGVGTALLFATTMSKKANANLTVLVRDDEADMSLYRSLLECHQISAPDQPIKVINLDRPSSIVPYNNDSIFITTSWWTTRSLMSSVPPQQIVYLIQEDERMFYPHGNLHLNASDVFWNEGIKCVVNTKILYDHFSRSLDNNITSAGLWFEPAFPCDSYYPDGHDEHHRQFLFYARPRTDRNLFLRGLEVIEESILRGYLDKSWEFVFIGANIPKLSLPNGCSYKTVENVNWETYLNFVRKTDLALSLMYTPHPSYPPLDVAACGGVAVTNQFGNKTSLDRYSKNLICTSVDVSSLVDGLRSGVSLALDHKTRKQNYADQRLSRNWDSSFEETLKVLLQSKEG